MSVRGKKGVPLLSQDLFTEAWAAIPEENDSELLDFHGNDANIHQAPPQPDVIARATKIINGKCLDCPVFNCFDFI
jgi:hypothetical protein